MTGRLTLSISSYLLGIFMRMYLNSETETKHVVSAHVITSLSFTHIYSIHPHALHTNAAFESMVQVRKKAQKDASAGICGRRGR